MTSNSIKVIYFNIAGRAEAIRLALNHGGIEVPYIHWLESTKKKILFGV
jgi:hypothetical protein